MKRTTLFFAAIVIFIFTAAIFTGAKGIFMAKDTPELRNGKMDLSEWDFDRQGVVALSGEWEFYWKRLISEDDIINGTLGRYDVLADVPEKWNDYVIDGGEIGGYGYATYRARVKLHHINELIYIKVNDFSSAYKLYVDDVLIGENGAVSDEQSYSMPEFDPAIYHYKTKRDYIDIVVQVSNFSHDKGGFWEPLYIGSGFHIAKLHQQSLISDFFLMGFMLSMALYHIVIASFIKRQKAFFYFAVFCSIMCARIMLTGERFALDVFGWIGWELAQKLEYLTFYAALPVFLKFMDTLFENVFSKRMNTIIYMISAAFVGLVVILPAGVYTRSVLLFQLLTLASGIYIGRKLYEAVKLRRTGSLEILIGFTLMLVLVTLEIVGTNGYEGYLGYKGMTFWGVMIFFFSMAFGVSKQFSLAFIETERLATENKRMLSKIRKLNRALKKRNTELSNKVSRDGLSGLYNHRYLHEKLHEKIAKAALGNTSFSIGMFDIDRFKDVNDNHGHQFGDKVIVEVARILAENTRGRDVVGRYGGEEFMIIFDGVDSVDCINISDRLREKVAKEIKEILGIEVTMSGGVVHLQQNEKPDEIIQRADRLLYRAKENGRNRIECEKGPV